MEYGNSTNFRKNVTSFTLQNLTTATADMLQRMASLDRLNL